MKYLTLALFLFSPLVAQANGLLCDHAFMGTPFATVQLEIMGDGNLADSALIGMMGQSHKEAVTQVAAASGEAFHLWISKGSTNEVEMIVYQEANGAIPAVLINHKVPLGQKVPGTCKETN